MISAPQRLGEILADENNELNRNQTQYAKRVHEEVLNRVNDGLSSDDTGEAVDWDMMVEDNAGIVPVVREIRDTAFDAGIGRLQQQADALLRAYQGESPELTDQK